VIDMIPQLVQTCQKNNNQDLLKTYLEFLAEHKKINIQENGLYNKYSDLFHMMSKSDLDTHLKEWDSRIQSKNNNKEGSKNDNEKSKQLNPSKVENATSVFIKRKLGAPMKRQVKRDESLDDLLKMFNKD